MYSLSWPKMFDNNLSTNIISDKEAIRSNLYLLLNSDRLSLFGDPYFGTNLKSTLFEQNTGILVDLLIDELYNVIITYFPQIYITRDNIKIYSDKTDMFAQILITYRLDNTSDLYFINLTNNISEV